MIYGNSWLLSKTERREMQCYTSWEVRKIGNQNHHSPRNIRGKPQRARRQRAEWKAMFFSPQKELGSDTHNPSAPTEVCLSELGVRQGGTGTSSSSVKMLSAVKFVWRVYFVWFMSAILVTIAWGPGCHRVEAFSRHRIQLENTFPAEIRLAQDLTTFTQSHKSHVWQNFSIEANKI